MRIGFSKTPIRDRPWVSRNDLYITLDRYKVLPEYIDRFGISIYQFPDRLFPTRDDGIPDVSNVKNLVDGFMLLSDKFGKYDIRVGFEVPRYCDVCSDDSVVRSNTIRILNNIGLITECFPESYISVPVFGNGNINKFENFEHINSNLKSSTKSRLVMRNTSDKIGRFSEIKKFYHRYKYSVLLDISALRDSNEALDGESLRMVMDSWDTRPVIAYGGHRKNVDFNDFWKTFKGIGSFVDILVDSSNRELTVCNIMNIMRDRMGLVL